MSQGRGLWITFGSGGHAQKVQTSIQRYGQFTKSVAISSVRPRRAELVVVSLRGAYADYIGISQKGRLTATDEATIAVSNLVPIDELSVNTIRSRLPSRVAFLFRPPQEGVYRPSPRLWESLQNIIAHQGNVGPRVDDLRHILDESARIGWGYQGGLEVFERDAIASALQTWGGINLRKRLLRGVVPNPLNPTAPFLSRIRDVSVPEDLQIVHDQITFPGLDVAKPAIVGSITLTNRERTEYLTILNCNRQPLERTLGVDLIYYNHVFDSFVLVQYKLMKGKSFGNAYQAEYRPDNDKSHASEMERMIKADNLLRSLPRRTDSDQVGSYRLSVAAFYLKLCEARVKTPLDAGMTPGMYLPLALWRRLLDSPVVQGSRGGRVITWDNCARRLNNGEFTNLLRHGWIGSAAGQSDALREIIEAVLSSNRMLVVAATSGGRSPRDMRRDDLGRFAAEDDPAAAM
jgi:hypothetical protein